ncbi:hypothetical protein [uncultured Mediterranean phage]|nr:hypothetical protein [uncultured Mediterranean phage]
MKELIFSYCMPLFFLLPYPAVFLQEMPPKHPTRQEWREKVAWRFLDHYAADLDEFNKIHGYLTLLPQVDHWFVIKIEAELGQPFWVKFALNMQSFHEPAYHRCPCRSQAQHLEALLGYPRLRKGLVRVFEQYLIDHWDDEEIWYTALHGEGHLYRLPTKDTDPATLKPRHRFFHLPEKKDE